MRVIIHYNIGGGTPDAHPEVKSQMQALYYYDSYSEGGTTYNLLNASLWHENKINPQAAISDLTRVVANINMHRLPNNKATIERCVTLEFGTHLAIPGKAHST